MAKLEHEPEPEKRLADDDPMPVGDRRGQCMSDVPAAYLLWCADQPFAKEPRWLRVVQYVEENRAALEAEAEAEAVDDDPDF